MKVWQPTPKEVENTEGWEIWNKEESDFQWQYDDKETCYIISGEAIVEDKLGNKIHFKTGDMVEFKKGLNCTWKIIQAIKKRYYFG